jgi:hypothetical protein
MSDDARLRKARQALASAVADIGHYPCRLDEMTDREQAIAGMVGTLVGAVQYVLEGPLREEEGTMSDATKGLPPGPWKALSDEDGDGLPPRVIIAADRSPVLVPVHGDEVGEIECSPEVLRAIEALPLLVEAVRRTIEDLESTAASPRYRSAYRLRQALALVDGEG